MKLSFLLSTLPLLLCAPVPVSGEPVHGTAAAKLEAPAAVTSPLDGSAILDVFPGTGAEYPKDLAEMRERFERMVNLKWLSDEVRTSYILQSNAPGKTSAEEPRELFGSEGGQLYIGAIKRLDGTYEFEFISWNEKKQIYDFGIVSDFGTPQAKVELADRRACMKCHLTGGPHYMRDDWRFSQNNAANIYAMLMARARLEKPYAPLKSILEKIDPTTDPFSSPEVVSFFKENLHLLRWNGIELPRLTDAFPQHDGFTGRNFEDIVTRGAVRAAASNYIQGLPSTREKRKFAADVLHMRMRRIFSREAAPEHVGLSRLVKDSPGHLPFLFSEKIEPGRKLLPTDFDPESKPLDPDHGEAVNAATGWLANTPTHLMRFDSNLPTDWENALETWKKHPPEKLTHFAPGTSDPNETMALAMLRAPILSKLAVEGRIGTDGDFLAGAGEAFRLIQSGWVPPHEPAPWSRDEEMVRPSSIPVIQEGSCLPCHKTMAGDLRFEFRVDEPEAWRVKLEMAQDTELFRLRRLRDAILSRLKNQVDPMPPADSDEWKAFTPERRKALADYLEGALPST